jgi:peptidoglycan hydrolase-like protein with peptidoglycan-binding domain
MSITVPLTRSVGNGGANIAGEVKLIQSLLNNWLRTTNASALSVDGIVGPRTGKAIVDFQKSFGGVADGRVDPNGATIKKLVALQVELLQKGATASVVEDARRRLKQSGQQVTSTPTDVDLAKELSSYLEAIKKT